MGIFDEVSSSGSGGGLSLFSGNSPLAQIGNAVVNQGIQYAASRVSTNNLPLFNAGLGTVTNLMNGNYVGAFNSVVNSGVLSRLVGSKKVPRWLQKSPLTAHLSMEELQRIYMLSYAIEHARKNLWLINISPYSAGSGILGSLGSAISRAAGNKVSDMVGGKIGNALGQVTTQAVKFAIANNPITSGLNEMGGGVTANFNMLATNVSYTPFSIESEQYNVGSAIIDGARSSQKAEISITTMDDEQGTIKKFFKQKASEIIHKDGTVGVLSDGLVQIRVLHAFVSDNTNQGGFEETIICRPVSIDYDLDRRTDEMQEFTMRFEQTDTFI